MVKAGLLIVLYFISFGELLNQVSAIYWKELLKKNSDIFKKDSPKIEWTKLLNTCRKPSFCSLEKGKTVVDCKERCAAEEKCALVKYNAKKEKCWLCESANLRHSNSCPVNYDFFIKATPHWANASTTRIPPRATKPVPYITWLEHLGVCSSVNSYKLVSKETAIDCKNTCAKKEKCTMVKYQAKKKKCWLSKTTQLRPSDTCSSHKYDFYIKVRVTKWVEHHGICKHFTSYKTLSKQTATDCKIACAIDERCAMVKYYDKKMRCWLGKSIQLRPSHSCPGKYDFYIKDQYHVSHKTKTPIRHLAKAGHGGSRSSYVVQPWTITIAICFLQVFPRLLSSFLV